MTQRPRLPQTYVISSSYKSFARCARDERELLRDLGCLAPSLEAAEVVVVHTDLGELGRVMRRLPGLKTRRCVGFLVWEADRLPAHAPNLGGLAAVWTPSWYSARSLVRAHPRVRVLPHRIMRSRAPSAQALATMDALLGPQGRCTLLQVGRTSDPRKGAQALKQAFLAVAARTPGLRLVRKRMPPSHAVEPRMPEAQHLGPITDLRGDLDDDLMAALYQRCTYVVSGHHGEGWGLTLSEGMAHGRPALAADYSGNLAFMHARNSVLVPGYEGQVRAADSSASHRAPMRWHYPLPRALEEAMAHAAAIAHTPAYDALATRAQKLARVYDSAHLRPIMRALLHEVAQLPAQGAS